WMRALKHRSGNVRATAATALGNALRPHRSAIVPLLLALADQDLDVVRASSTSLNKIDPAWRTSNEAGEFIPSLIQSLTTAANSDDKNARWRIASALELLSHPTAVEPLILLLKDNEPSVRGKAAAALGSMGD